MPQWQGIPLAEQEAFSALGCQLFVSIRTGCANNGLLVIGRRKGGNTYSREEMESIELLAHQAATAMEITHLHHQLDQQQQELHQARGQMASSTRMTAIEEAISASAQEIESSLQTVSALVHEMNQQAYEQNASKQTIDALKAEIIHAHDALLPLLDLLKDRQSTRSIHNLNSLLLSVVSTSGLNTSDSKIKLTLLLDPSEPHIWCDEEQIRQVFVNLAANALDAIPTEGYLDISTRVVEDMVEIKFTDTGVRIPEEQLEKVFDTFFTTKSEDRGSGIGLASSRMTVERHQGTITVVSRVGEGTIVTVVLPVQPTLFGHPRQSNLDVR